MSGTKRSQSVLSRCSPSDGVLLREITVQCATYVINGENDDTRSTRWKEVHSASLEATPAVMPRACLLVIGRAFLVLDARVGQWRENTLVLTIPTPFVPFRNLYIHCLAFYVHDALHEKLREAATRARRPSLLNVFPPLFFLNHRSRFSLPGKKGAGWDERREDADKSSLQCSRDVQVLIPLARVRHGLKENREAPSGIQESEHRWMRRGGVLFNISFWSRPFSRARGLERRHRCRQNRGKGNG